MCAALRLALRDALLISLIALSGCAAPTATPRAITATPDFTPTPAPTPTPPQALNPDHLWVGSDAPSRQVIVASPEGEVATVPLPLNAGQTAAELAASPDGRYLAYLVWNADSEQHGIAMWNLAEPFARLIVQPLPGYLIISLMFSADSASLLYVQVDAPSAWRMESIPVGGGQSALLADQQSAPDMAQVQPFAWSADQPLYFTAYSPRQSSPTGSAYDLYSLETDTGLTTRLTTDDDWVLPPPALSPDGARLAFLAGSPDETGVWSVKVLDLAAGSAITIPPPEGGTVVSLAWQPDSQHLLLDVLTDIADRASQTFALVNTGDNQSWVQLPPDPAREHLITYQPYRDGVAYTILPEADSDPWTLTLFDEVGPDTVPQLIPLGRPDAGAPRIVRVPSVPP